MGRNLFISINNIYLIISQTLTIFLSLRKKQQKEMISNNLLTPQLAIVPQPFIDEVSKMIREINDFLLSNKSDKDLSDEWVDSKEARKILRVSAKTLQNYRDNRIIPFSQFGYKIYYKREDLEDFFNRHYIKAN
jgi:hypothetical protein